MQGASDDVPPGIDPQDAFQLFSHELRLEILFALWEAPRYALTFSEIQEAVGERDSGKFTYHLEQLTGQFVTEVEGQYVLQYAGHRVIDAIQSGVFHTSPTVSPVEAPGACTVGRRIPARPVSVRSGRPA
jgi:DNA-binding transcriptional ArsR family regulator